MIMTQISREYAAALFMLACEEKREAEYKKALEIVEKEFKNQIEYIDFLASPSIPIDERLDAIDAAFSNVLPEYVLYFLKLLCEKNHIESIFECILEYNNLFDGMKNVSNAKVKSVVELSETEKEALQKKLEKISGKNVNMNFEIDSSIGGGLIIELDGNIIDASIRRYLKDIKDVISK